MAPPVSTWKVVVSFDGDKEAAKIGTITGTHYDQNGNVDCTYSRRLTGNDDKDITAFVTEAKTALQGTQSKVSDEASFASTVEAKLNG